MNPVAKTLVFIGIAFIVIGLLWQAGGEHLRFGRLPGDITVERERFRFYFPIATSIVVSAILTLVLWLIQHFKN